MRDHPPHLLGIFNGKSKENKKTAMIVSITSPFKPSHFEMIEYNFNILTAFVTGWHCQNGDKIAIFIENNEFKTAHIYPNTKEAQSIINSNLNNIYYQLASYKKQYVKGFHLTKAISTNTNTNKNKNTNTNTNANSNANSQIISELIWSKSFKNSAQTIVDISFMPKNQKIINAMFCLLKFILFFLFLFLFF